ncbi:peptide-methionine (S)-S-oxide reductase MsrA [Limnobacter litoralis]|uniref:Peptide methionine sulfoxide reductase MsrA n=1 Tax=Limnobacter litoralis TaxID=481366 RepID=A0ABQ5YTF8_9BURK|nr:peptide-methionine (S)-S-oxide reductase MsrA [Limnobacter litoralis]GLR27100.1 peptide methionine sulfoxide reductase MsrA [Limnobacter litoralis]
MKHTPLLRLSAFLPLAAGLFISLAGLSQPARAATETAVFAGGCFWCVESDFDKVAGVIETTSGYAGGTEASPNYQTVSAGQTGYAESVRVTFDNSKVSYSQLVEYFWKTIDPTVQDRQFCDEGHQYRTAIFYQNDAQKKVAEASKAKLVASGKFPHVYTEVAPVLNFYPAESYHQNYYQKNPIRYEFYRLNCGRDNRVKELWGKSVH